MIHYTEPAHLECSVSLIVRLHDILDSGNYTSNKFTALFEKSFKEEFNLKGQCIAVNGCQNGLFLTLVALGVHRPLLPDFTFSATAHAAYYACRDFKVGDCDPRTFNIEPKGRPECDAVIGTHVFGNICDCQEIGEIAEELNVPVVYDAAHAIGASYRGIPAGDLGTASVFSLSPTKALTSCEGGMIVTQNQCLADKLRKLRNYGNEPDYDCKNPGLNARMSEVHACFGLESLACFGENYRKRMSLVSEYQTYFGEEITQKVTPSAHHSWKDFSILVGSKREKVCKALSEHQIEYRTYFRPISALSCYEGWQSPQLNSLRLYHSILQLPLCPQLECEDVHRICRIVSGVLSEPTSAMHDIAKPAHVTTSHHVITSSGKG
jgi:dTDP-4-amino-4,6-dideoxygalactose transaminase